MTGHEGAILTSSAHGVQVQSLTKTGHGTWELNIAGFSEAGALGTYIWPDGLPAGVHITPLIVVTEPSPVGTFQISGMTTTASATMDPWWNNYFNAHMQDVTSSDSPHPSSGEHGGAGHEPVHMPGAEEREHAERLRERIINSEHTLFTVGEIVGMFAEEGSTIALLGEVLGGFGDGLAVATVLYATWHEFGQGLRDEENRGAMYGLIWQAIGQTGDIWPTYGNAYAGGAGLPWDSEEELKDAFDEGVAKGRALAHDIKTHNRVAAAVAYKMTILDCDLDFGASTVLTEIWQAATGGTKHQWIFQP